VRAFLSSWPDQNGNTLWWWVVYAHLLRSVFLKDKLEGLLSKEVFLDSDDLRGKCNHSSDSCDAEDIPHTDPRLVVVCRSHRAAGPRAEQQLPRDRPV
jgi:hypothetical protein